MYCVTCKRLLEIKNSICLYNILHFKTMLRQHVCNLSYQGQHCTSINNGANCYITSINKGVFLYRIISITILLLKGYNRPSF